MSEFVHRWLTAETAKIALRKNGHAMRGFQWKDVFLPDGTGLRTCHLGTVEFAKVVGDRILAEDGTSLTPSQFANRHATGRNAWLLVWLRFPGDEFWIRAGNYRARMDARPVPQGPKAV